MPNLTLLGRLALLAAIGVVPQPCAYAVNGGPCSKASTIVERDYSGWALVTTGQLSRDDQAIWAGAYGDASPGLAEGHFLDDGQRQCAVLLTRGKQGAFEQVILIVGQSGVLKLGPYSSSRVSVLRACPAGSYETLDDGAIELERDGLLLEQLEAGVMLIVPTAGGRRFVLSE